MGGNLLLQNNKTFLLLQIPMVSKINETLPSPKKLEGHTLIAQWKMITPK